MTEIRYIDIHAHLNFPDYDKDRDEVVLRAKEKGVAIINIGTDIESSKQILEIADTYRSKEGIEFPHIYSMPGIHPVEVQNLLKEFEPEESVTQEGELLSSDQKKLKILLKADKVIEEWLVELEKLADHSSVVGIGECGIDVFRFENDLARAPADGGFKLPADQLSIDGVLALQTKLFIGQINIALKRDIPIMIHARESYINILSILDENFISQGIKLKGNVHFFAGTPAEARMFLDRGFTVSFTGVITFAKEYAPTIAALPPDSVMSETDCPFVAPVPYRGGRNEPVYVIEVVRKMAQIRGIEEPIMAEILLRNARKAFGIKL